MKVATFATVLSFALISAISQAQITIIQHPGNFKDDENVLFNDRTLQQEGNFVQGHTNKSNWIVDFESSTELAAHGGQSRIEALSGKNDTFSDLSVRLHDSSLSMSTLIWNLDAVDDGEVTFTVNHSAGVYTETFTLDKNGQNFFRFAGDGVSMNSVSFSSSVGISDVKQVRLGAVPEPASLLGLGLGAVAFLRRRNKKTV